MNNIIFKFFLPFFVSFCGFQATTSYSWEAHSCYNWKLHENDTLIAKGFLDVKFESLPIESFDILSQYQDRLTALQYLSSCLDRESLGALQAFFKITIETTPENEPKQDINDKSLFTFFSCNTHIYNRLNIISSPIHRKRSIFAEMAFLFFCCCFCCDEHFYKHCGYNRNHEKNLEEATLTKRNDLTYNVATYLDTIHRGNQGEEIETSKKIEPPKTPIISIFILNHISIRWISKILNNQHKANETLMIIPFDEYPVKYKIYTHKHPEIEQVDNSIAPTHKITFTDSSKQHRKLILQVHRKSIETILLLSCEYKTETCYLFRINNVIYNDELYQFPPTYEEVENTYTHGR